MLRPIQKSDTPSLLEIENLTQFSPWSIETFERCWQAGYKGWVLEKDQKIIGFLIVSFQAGEIHILNLCIHPQFQRQGFGQKLIKHLFSITKSQGGGVIFLEVRKFNKNAIALYKKMNFVQIGERKNYYDSPKGREDALVFAIDTEVI